MVFQSGIGNGVRDHHYVVAEVIGFAGSRLDAIAGRDAGQHHLGHACASQRLIQAPRAERPPRALLEAHVGGRDLETGERLGGFRRPGDAACAQACRPRRRAEVGHDANGQPALAEGGGQRVDVGDDQLGLMGHPRCAEGAPLHVDDEQRGPVGWVAVAIIHGVVDPISTSARPRRPATTVPVRFAARCQEDCSAQLERRSTGPLDTLNLNLTFCLVASRSAGRAVEAQQGADGLGDRRLACGEEVGLLVRADQVVHGLVAGPGARPR